MMTTMMTEKITAQGKPAKAPRVLCEHCSTFVPNNVYSRNHGDKCPYKGMAKGFKMCKSCHEPVAIESFSKVSAPTFDGRNSTCNACLSKKYGK